MKVKVSRLREVLGLLAPISPKKPPLPSMNYILFADGKAATTDMENTVFLDFAEAEDAILVPRDALDWLKFIPGDRTADIHTPENDPSFLVIDCESSRRTWPLMKLSDYPALRQPVENHLRIDGDQMLDALQRAVPYVCKEDSRPVLAGVTVVMDESGITVSSGDGFRMFLQKLPGSPLDEATLVLPTSAIKVLKTLWRNESRPDNPDVDALLAQVALSKRLMNVGLEVTGPENNLQTYMSIRFNNVCVITHLISGTPPTWKDLIPNQSAYQLKVFTEDVYRALKQVQGVAKQGSGLVRFSWQEATLKLTATGEGQTVEADCFVTVEKGGDGFMGFNVDYLVEYFKSRQGLVQMCFTEPTHPGLFVDGRFYVIIMPMNVTPPPNSNGDKGDKGEEQPHTPEPKQTKTQKKIGAKPKDKPKPAKKAGKPKKAKTS